MTEYYQFLGQNQVTDWTVSNVKDNSFMIRSSEVASHTYEKIVETYALTVGQTQQIAYQSPLLLTMRMSIIESEEDGQSESESYYTSKNKGIASVSNSGLITANGEKGTTYIKITTNDGNVWVKVIVGDDYADLWYDYSELLNYNYAQMRNLMGEPDQISTENNCYSYITSIHDVISYINVFINPITSIVEQVDMFLKEGVPSIQIISYMDARYYTLGETDGVKFYYTSPEYEDSRAIFAYAKNDNYIMIVPAEGFLDMWKDYKYLFGQKSEDIKQDMSNNGFTYLMTDYSYAQDGSDYYNIPNNNAVTMVGFVFNQNKEMCEYWVYLNKEDGDANAIYSFLNEKYIYDENETGNPNYGPFVYYNADHSIRVTFSLEGYVKYECLEMVPPTPTPPIPGLWPDYSTALGKTHDGIVAEYGTPFMDDDSGIWYILVNDNVDYLNFRPDATTGVMKYVSLILNDALETSTVVDYLGSLYTVFENGTASDGSQYAWTNGPSLSESTFGVVYFPEDKHVLYQSLASPSSKPHNAPFLIESFNPIKNKANLKLPFTRGKRMSFVKEQPVSKRQKPEILQLLNKLRP